VDNAFRTQTPQRNVRGFRRPEAPYHHDNDDNNNIDVDGASADDDA
jgi:hypothetical protein